ncbi:MAG: DUF1648 domain-containing protein [Acidimicrobiia bacterium]|nr:DUF1648 domain-containing protein [Acidimicrobiia bacterium]
MTRRQKWSHLTLGVLIAGTIAVVAALAWGDLPGSIATHWSLNGTPNGHMPPAALLLGVMVVVVSAWMAVSSASQRMPGEARSFIAGFAGIGGLLGVVTWFAIDANRGAADWTAAGEVTAVHLVVVFAAALMLGSIGWVIAGRSNATGGALAVTPGPTIRVEAGTDPVWSGRGRGVVLIVIGIGLVVLAAALWSLVSLLLLVTALPVIAFAEVRATVSRRGVVVSLGWLGIPHWRVRLEEIAGAEVEHVSPMAYGGWGYRLRPGIRGIIVRGGDSIRIRRIDRPDLVLTVDDAERGVGLINGFIAER